jgi:hypothetical protein
VGTGFSVSVCAWLHNETTAMLAAQTRGLIECDMLVPIYYAF